MRCSVKRTVEELETAGVSALTIEDTLLPIAFGGDDAQLISIEEGVGKMRAALAGRQDPRLVIVGRTSAIGITGVDDTIARLKAYEAVGVDMLFMAGLKNRAQLDAVSSAVKKPLFLGSVPEDMMDLDYLSARNVRVCLQGHHQFWAGVQGVHDTLKALREGTKPSAAEERRLGRPAEEAAAPGRLCEMVEGFSEHKVGSRPMRAYQLPKGGAGIDALTKVERPKPKPGHRQVLVKVAACSLNFRDLGIVRGTYRMPVRDNIIPLSDGAGEVVEVGSGVTRVKVGDKVAGNFFQRWPGGEPPPDVQSTALGGGIDGMLAEYVVLEEEGVVKIPAHLSLEEGATLPCAGVTVWHAMMEHGKLIAGQTVLLQGTGGVSVFGLQLAHAMGMQSVITSSSDDKLAKAKKLGASHTINYKTTPDWEKAAMEFTGGRGVDHVVEVGGAGTLRASRSARSASAARSA